MTTCAILCIFCVFKQKTAYEMRISDWSSDVCSSDLIEQAAFSPSNVVPGIGHSPDKMLQARIFSYADAHRYRLGTHYEALPVNQPKCPVHHYHKDGAMRFFRNDTGNPDAYYEPNSMKGRSEEHTSELQSLMRISY